jgi:hypothetical protein
MFFVFCDCSNNLKTSEQNALISAKQRQAVKVLLALFEAMLLTYTLKVSVKPITNAVSGS